MVLFPHRGIHVLHQVLVVSHRSPSIRQPTRTTKGSAGGTGGVTRAQARSLVGRDAHDSAVTPNGELAAIPAVTLNNTGDRFIERCERFVTERAA